MKTFFKSSVSVGLLLLVFCTQVVIPITQSKNGFSASPLDNSFLLYEDEGLSVSDFIFADQSDAYSIRVEGGNTLFYILSAFSLEKFHNLIVGIKWELSTLIDLQFTLADKIFPFACFW